MRGTISEDVSEDLHSAEEQVRIQRDFLKLLEKQISLYTLGESSSLPEYDAYRLLASTCFVLGVDPGDPGSVVMCANADGGIQEVFNRNLLLIEKKAARFDALWKEVCLSVPLLESVSLRDTLEGLRGFGDRYAPRFFAHELPCEIDYPLCFPVSESLQGVDYVTIYLQRLLVECRFLQLFDIRDCRRILTACHEDYGELIMNLFEPIASCALGCALAGCDAHALTLEDDGFRRLRDRVGMEGEGNRLADMMDAAADRVVEQLAIENVPTRHYLDRLARSLVPRIRVARQHGGLAGVFAFSPSEGSTAGWREPVI